MVTDDDIFYTQMRLGKNGKKFKLIKFRTMSSDKNILKKYFEKHPSEKVYWNKYQKLLFDPRITKAGFFLRKYSLDELPQIFNILKGDMSFIGPRPYLLEEVEEYKIFLNLYKTVKPGLSGLWQVSGRNNTTFKERVSLDTFYINNKTFLMDIKIFFKTFVVVLLKKGAY